MSNIRSSRMDSAHRAYGGVARGTIEKVNDDPKVQEHDLNLLGDDSDQVFGKETKAQVERFGNYGHSSVPLPPTEQSSSSSSGGSSAQDTHAEAIVGFVNGNRSHALILAVDDRRHRPLSLKPGESAMYDHQAQKIHITNDGVEISGGDDNLKQPQQSGSGSGGSQGRSKKLPIKLFTGDASHLIEKDKITSAVKQTTRTLEDGKHELKVGDDCLVRVEGDKVTVQKGSMMIIVSASRVDLGGTGGSGVLTEAGTSTKVFAVL